MSTERKDVVIEAPMAIPSPAFVDQVKEQLFGYKLSYKLSIYQPMGDSMALVHFFFSDSREDLENRAQYHLGLNENYLCILNTYRMVDSEILR